MPLTKLNNASLSAVTSAGIPVSAGSVLQTVFATTGSNSAVINTTSTTFVEGGLQVSITPTSTNSKILLMVNVNAYAPTTVYNLVTIYRGSTNLAGGTNSLNQKYTGGGSDGWIPLGISHIDSPASTSEQTYKLMYRSDTGSTVYLHEGKVRKSQLIAMEIAG
jgi:hypothetical protein